MFMPACLYVFGAYMYIFVYMNVFTGTVRVRKSKKCSKLASRL